MPNYQQSVNSVTVMAVMVTSETKRFICFDVHYVSVKFLFGIDRLGNLGRYVVQQQNITAHSNQ